MAGCEEASGLDSLVTSACGESGPTTPEVQTGVVSGGSDLQDSSRSHGDLPARHGFFDAAWLGYVVAVLSIVFGASQVAPDGWRRVMTAGLLLVAAITGAVAFHLRRARVALAAVAAVALALALPAALLPSSKEAVRAGDGLIVDRPNGTPSPSASLTLSSPSGATDSPSMTASRTPAAPKEQTVTVTVVIGVASELYDRSIAIGLSSAYSDRAIMNVFAGPAFCDPLFIDVGQTVQFVNSGSGQVFELTLMATKADESVRLRVKQRNIVEGEYGSPCL